ncbi:Spy/CpxP family protein refolding chaperone [Novosphingobium sp.]|uniref:Spy/CpxP family protein refolding chaperone n=1 Tax=Novosphingobium sp. TaxID=1874826 RepID=UPI003B51DC10
MKMIILAMGASLALASGAADAQGYGQQGGQTSGPSQIEQLHQALHLTAMQEGAWQLYRSGADAPDKAQARRRSASSLFRTLDAPHRMDLVEAEMRQELDDLQRQSQALKAFYAGLTPDQRRIFDARTLPPVENQQQY